MLWDTPFTRKSERRFPRERKEEKEKNMGKEELITNPNESAIIQRAL